MLNNAISIKAKTNRITSKEEQLYLVIEKGVLSKKGISYNGKSVKKKDYIDISKFGYSNKKKKDRQKVYQTYRKVFYDHPECFWLSEGIYRYSQNGEALTGIIPFCKNFVKSKKQANAYEKKIEKKLQKILESISEVTDPVEQAYAVYQYLASNIIYNKYVAEKKEEEAPSYVWTSYGALVKSDAVCKGIAFAYKQVLDFLNNPRLHCIIVTSKEMNHIWNIIEINGEAYHVDVNRAVVSKFSEEKKECFLVSDSKMKEMKYTGWKESTPRNVPKCVNTQYDNR